MFEISSWVIGSSGAIIIVTNSIFQYLHTINIETSLQSLSDKISRLSSENGILTENYRLAELKKAFADSYIPQLMIETPGKDFLLNSLANHMRGALLTMYLATDMTPPNEEPEEISRIRKNDPIAYDEVSDAIEDLKLRYKKAYESRHSLIKEYEQERNVKSLKKRKRDILFFVISIIGMVMILLKDIPIWGNT